MDITTVPKLEQMSKQQLIDQISRLQKQIDESCGCETSCVIKHDLEVHQIELEMQNRELLETQLQLEEVRDNYADLYDFAPVNYISFDQKGFINNINLTGASMLGELRTHLIGRPFSKWLKKDDLIIFNRHLLATLESDEKVVNELKIKTSKGELIDVRIESIRYKYQDTNIAMCRSVILDITESNRIKEEIFLQARQLKLITDALPVLVAYIDINEKHLFANKTYIDSFELESGNILGMSAKEVWGASNYKSANTYLKLSFAGQQVKFDMELPLGKEGKKYFHTTLIPDVGANSNIYGVIALIGDITDRLAIEAIDRKRLLDIAHFSRLSSMGEMASEIAHELNQPLAAISIYSDACRRLILSEKANQKGILQSLTDISLQAERAGATIRHIREFVSKKETQRNNVNMNEVVQSALQLLAVEMRSHNTKLVLMLVEDMPSTIVDKILIEQVIFNLIRNALEAMDEIEDSKRILTIKTSVTKLNEIEVCIEDSGPGLPPDKLKHIFDPFLSTKTNGMGMGLAISQSIIEAHHGRLWATSNNHGGTTFSFTLPILVNEDNYDT